MELRQLRYFEAVARREHFTHAAHEIGITQPALSIQLRKLEDSLDGKLFERTSHGARLTNFGATLLPIARRALAEVDGMIHCAREFNGGHVGEVSLGSQQSLTASGHLPAVLREFRQSRPNVDLTMREDLAERVLPGVRDGDLDLALLMVLPESTCHEGVCLTRLYEEDLVFTVGPQHPLAEVPNSLPLKALADECFITFNPGAALRTVLIDVCRTHGFTPRIAYESDALSSVWAVTSAGLGVALLPQGAVRSTGCPLVELPIRALPRRAVALATPADRYQSPAATALADLLLARFSSGPGRVSAEEHDGR